MPRSGTLGNSQPYTPFGVFAGLPFWGGGLTLLAAAPGIGKTSWLLRMIFETATLHIPSPLAVKPDVACLRTGAALECDALAVWDETVQER